MHKASILLIYILLPLTFYAQEESPIKEKVIKNGKTYFLYKVQESEGFMAIGRKFGVPHQDIIDANTESILEGLKVGQSILIPAKEEKHESSKAEKAEDYHYHKVRVGETIFSISRSYGVTISDIVTSNPGSDEVLKLGQDLKIPKPNETTDNENITNNHAPQPLPSEAFHYHTIAPKETASAVKRKYGVSLKSLSEANPEVELNKLSIGTVLRIPKNEAQTKVALLNTPYLYHRIKKNETLDSIAAHYNLPPGVIKERNALGEEFPPVGYMLKIPHAYKVTMEVESEEKTVYIIKRKDDIRQIAEQFQVPIIDIKAANPQVKKWRKLKKGTTLNIPITLTEQVDSVIVREQEEDESEDTTEYFEQQKDVWGDTINVAFLWPLFLEKNSSTDAGKIYPQNPIFREFYWGALIALNDLKNSGIPIKLKHYDTAPGEENIQEVLKTADLSGTSLIFGPAFDSHVRPVADFCLKNHIRLVVPFLSEYEALAFNPYIFQIVPSKAAQYAHIAQRVAERHKDANIIMVKGETPDERETTLSDLLKSELYAPDSSGFKSVSYTEVDYKSGSMKDIFALLSEEKQNLIVIPGEKEEIHSAIIPMLGNRASRNESIDLKLIGFSEWQKIKGSELENLFKVGCEIYSPFYADLFSADSTMIEFKSKFSNYYKTLPTNQYPYYGMLGYDVSSFFIKGLNTYGQHLESEINNIDHKGLCVDFNFKRINSWGGFVNTTIYTIDYTKEFETIVRDY